MGYRTKSDPNIIKKQNLVRGWGMSDREADGNWDDDWENQYNLIQSSQTAPKEPTDDSETSWNKYADDYKKYYNNWITVHNKLRAKWRKDTGRNFEDIKYDYHDPRDRYNLHFGDESNLSLGQLQKRKEDSIAKVNAMRQKGQIGGYYYNRLMNQINNHYDSSQTDTLTKSIHNAQNEAGTYGATAAGVIGTSMLLTNPAVIEGATDLGGSAVKWIWKGGKWILDNPTVQKGINVAQKGLDAADKVNKVAAVKNTGEGVVDTAKSIYNGDVQGAVRNGFSIFANAADAYGGNKYLNWAGRVGNVGGAVMDADATNTSAWGSVSKRLSNNKAFKAANTAQSFWGNVF